MKVGTFMQSFLNDLHYWGKHGRPDLIDRWTCASSVHCDASSSVGESGSGFLSSSSSEEEEPTENGEEEEDEVELGRILREKIKDICESEKSASSGHQKRVRELEEAMAKEKAQFTALMDVLGNDRKRVTKNLEELEESVSRKKRRREIEDRLKDLAAKKREIDQEEESMRMQLSTLVK
jgi:hypothetical protein